LQLAPAVHVEGVRLIVLLVRGWLLAVENVVSAEVKHGEGGLSASDSHITSALCVHLEGEIGPVLAVVHRGKSSGVDHDLGLGAVEGSLHKVEIGDVDFGQIRRNDLMARPEVGR
jgi:hypothetical protein